MGSEGVRLLDMREVEIGDMKKHLKNILKVMESRSRVGSKVSSHFMITRPLTTKQSEPHLRPVPSRERKPRPGATQSRNKLK